MNRYLIATAVMLAVAASGGCSYLTTDKEAYRNSRSLPQLKRPEGVEIPPPNYTYRVPEEAPATAKKKEVPAPKPEPESLPVFVEPKKTPSEAPEQSEKPKPTLENEAVPVFVTRQQLTEKMAMAESAKPKVATTRNWFVLDAKPEKLWAKLVAYWMQRGIPLVESNPVSGRIVTDWVPALDEQLRRRGIRDQFEVLLERHEAGSKITLKHRASRKTVIKGDKPAWALLGTDEALQGVETVRLRDYLTGK